MGKRAERPTEGNLIFDKMSGNLIEVGGNTGNSLANNKLKKMYAKIKGEPSNDSYFSIRKTATGTFKISKYPKFNNLSKSVRNKIERIMYNKFTSQS